MRHVLLTLATGVALAACGGSPSTGPHDGLVPDGLLARLVPDAADWVRGEVTSLTVLEPSPTAQASASFSRAAATVELVLSDTLGEPAMVDALAAVAGSSMLQETVNGYMKGTILGGFPAVESWNPEAHLGEITVLVERRFIVAATGSSLDRIEDLRALIEQFDFAAIAALQRRPGSPTA